MSEQRSTEPVAAPPEKPRGRNKNAWAHSFDLKASHWVEIFLTAALLCVGSTQAFIYWRQAGIMKEQADISARQVDLMQIDERPWVTLQSTELRSTLKIKDKTVSLWLGYKLKNLGHSPAFDTTFYTMVIPIWITKP